MMAVVDQIVTMAGSCGWNVVSQDAKAILLSCVSKPSITCSVSPMDENTASFSISSPIIGTSLKEQLAGMSFDNLDLAYELPTVLRVAAFLSLKLGENPVQQYTMEAKSEESKTPEENYKQARELLARNVHERNLFLFWKNSCALTGLEDTLMLSATFAKQPKDCSNNSELMDNHNGFLLEARYAKLFEAGYITFEKDGALVISPRLPASEREFLGIDASLKLRKVDRLHQKYLLWHRQHVFLASTK